MVIENFKGDDEQMDRFKKLKPQRSKPTCYLSKIC
jgi:hypothetical protein